MTLATAGTSPPDTASPTITHAILTADQVAVLRKAGLAPAKVAALARAGLTPAQIAAVAHGRARRAARRASCVWRCSSCAKASRTLSSG